MVPKVFTWKPGSYAFANGTLNLQRKAELHIERITTEHCVPPLQRRRNGATLCNREASATSTVCNGSIHEEEKKPDTKSGSHTAPILRILREGTKLVDTKRERNNFCISRKREIESAKHLLLK